MVYSTSRRYHSQAGRFTLMSSRFTQQLSGTMFLFSLLFSLSTVSCDLDVPANDLAEAKTRLSRAREVKAEKFAPAEYRNGEDALIRAHRLIQAEKVKKAREEARVSSGFSKSAIDISLPLLARESLDSANARYAELDPLNAEEFAPVEFGSAGTLTAEAQSLLERAKYWDSHLKAVEALKAGDAAKEASLAKVPELQQRLEAASRETGELMQVPELGAATGELEKAGVLLQAAGDDLRSKNLKRAAVEIRETEELLKKIVETTVKPMADGKLQTSSGALASVNASPSAPRYADDLARVTALLAESKELFDKGSFRESIARSNEAAGLLARVQAAMKEETASPQKRDEKKKPDEESAEGELKRRVVYYSVKQDDCLWKIAEAQYRNARLWPLIYVANKDSIKDPDLIFPGQLIVIPELRLVE